MGFTPGGGSPTSIIKGSPSNNTAEVTADGKLKIEVSYAPDAIRSKGYISITIGDGATPVVVGTTGYSAPLPFSGDITGWTISEISSPPLSSTISVDIWKDSVINYPPTAADKISGTEPPALTASKVAVDSTLTTWTTPIAVNDCLGFTVAATDGLAKKIMLIIYMDRNVV